MRDEHGGIDGWQVSAVGFDAFFEATSEQLVGEMYLVCGDLGEAQDCVQEAVGILCGQRGTHDAIGASVVLNARRRDQTVITSDPADLRHLDVRVRIIEI